MRVEVALKRKHANLHSFILAESRGVRSGKRDLTPARIKALAEVSF
jgi:hypothetical protein